MCDDDDNFNSNCDDDNFNSNCDDDNFNYNSIMIGVKQGRDHQGLQTSTCAQYVLT